MLTKRLLTISTLAILMLPAAPVLAEGGSGGDSNTSGSGSASATGTETETHSALGGDSRKIAASKTEDANKSAENKLKACQNREASINQRLQNIASRGQKQLDLFTTIANRVEQYYTNHNLSLANYNTLVANVNTQKAAAQTTVDTIKADSVSFSCTSGDPKAALTAFKTDLKSEISALKSYRTTIKDLITGVKSVAGTTEGQTNG